MIDFTEAYNTVLNSSFKMKIEKINLEQAIGRVLAENVFSDINMPPFNKSAMDGYACRSEDLENRLTQIELIPAGQTPKKIITKNTCAKIMTGAPVPEGADTVFKVEDSKILDSGEIIYMNPKPNYKFFNSKKFEGINICKLGEDIKTDDKVLSKGTLLKVQHIAVLASVGCVLPEVYCRPKVGVVATGSELVEPDMKPEKSQIRNSNGLQMVAGLHSIGAEPTYYGIATDSPEATYKKLQKARDENDIILISGGVSVGDFDFVPAMIKKLDFEILFDKVAVQPGKPVTFARKSEKICFGMPGNPVSAFVKFQLLVKPLIFKVMGVENNELKLKLPLENDYQRKKAGRLKWIPAKITKNGTVAPVIYHGSAHINGLAQADVIMSIPIDVTFLNKGDLVDVRQI